MAGTVQISTQGNVTTLTISRAHGNAINGELVADLTAALAELAADDAVRGVRMTGAGKLFSPGLDLQELAELDRADMSIFLERFATCILDLYAFPKPLVAALQGHAIAGGCVLALCTDWRLLNENALVGLNEIRVGVPFPFGVAMILRESVPKRRLEEVVVFGRNYRGDEALDAGLVHEVLPAADFAARSMECTSELADKDTDAFSITKRYLRDATITRIRTHEAEHHNDFLDCWFSDGTQTRIGEILAELRARKS